MCKIYRLHPNIILGSAFSILLSCVIMFFFGRSDLIAAIGLGIIIITVILLSNLYGMWGKVVVNDKGVTAGAKLYFDFRRSLKWDEIRAIEYKQVLFFRTIRLIALGSKLVEITRTIALSTLIENYPQLLCDVIMNTYDVTKIDPEVVKLAGMTQEELGNRRSTTLIRVIE